MINVAAGTVWNLPNFTGELFTADLISTPLLSMVGGLTGGVMTDNFEFPTSSEYAHAALVQRSITETGSLTAPAPISYVRDQKRNVTQIFHESVSLSYARMSNQGRLTGINTAGKNHAVANERDWQIARALEAIARQVEWHFLNGTFAISTTSGTPNQTRGLIPLCTDAGGTTVAAASAAFSRTLFNSLLLAMFTAGAQFRNVVLFANGFQRMAVSREYGFAPESRTVGGVNLQQIDTDFGTISIAPAHRFMPTGTILLAEVSALDVVFQPVPGKGNLFYEELSKTGAAEVGQIFGQIGLAHGPAPLHGTLTGLATS